MSPTLEEQLRHYGATFNRVLDMPRPEPHTSPAKGSRRPPRVLAAAMIVAIAGAVVLVVATRGNRTEVSTTPAGWTTFTDPTHAFKVAYPPSWQRATTSLTPSLTDPKEILSIGTYPLRPGGGECAQYPVNALSDLGDSGALISVQERQAFAGLGPRPNDLPPSDPSAGDEISGCVPGSGLVHWWIPFDDQGRSFYVLVAFGPHTQADVQTAAWDIVRGLQFTAPLASAGTKTAKVIRCPGGVGAPALHGGGDGLPAQGQTLQPHVEAALSTLRGQLNVRYPGAVNAAMERRKGDVWTGVNGGKFHIVHEDGWQLVVTVQNKASCPSMPSSFDGVPLRVVAISG